MGMPHEPPRALELRAATLRMEFLSIEAMNWALQQTVGSPAGKSVLLILANRADPEGLCYPGIDSIDRAVATDRHQANQASDRPEAGVFRAPTQRHGAKNQCVYPALCSRCTLQ